ncbi:MAG: VWA domain-containing protein [Actinobacteria bacterium]|nr:MAG: VWA domain-containing protein [Actinomycetota bacterium]
MSFAWPIALVGLLVVPALLALYVWYERRRVDSAERFGNPDLLPNVVERTPGRLRHLPLVLLLVALIATIVGVARPHATVSVPREEATIILAMDVSRSMKATDVRPTRLDAARAAAKAFVAKVPAKYRVGVVSFATRAVVGVPPTADRSLVDESLDSLSPGEGTAIGDAVALSLQMGRKQRTSDGIVPPLAILVISDGARDGGRIAPQTASAEARKQGVPVYAILVGTDNGVLQERLTGGLVRYTRVPPSPQTLSQLAQVSRGELFTAPDDKRLADVFEKLGSRVGTRKESREITDFFAGGAAALLFAGGAISALLFRRVP